LENNFNRVIFSDEVIFKLDGKSVRVWHKDDEAFMLEEKFDPYNKEKIHMWGAISNFASFEPYFFEGHVSSETYIECLKKSLLPKL